MSTTEIYVFGKDGFARYYAETRNAWRGAIAIWSFLEEKYLPPYIPDYVTGCNWFYPSTTPQEVEKRLGYKPTRLSPTFKKGNNPTQEIWDLADDLRLSRHERIVLHTTFDHCLVKKEDIPVVVKAFRTFEGETSLPEQADILDHIAQEDDVIAVGWNQTSISADNWGCFGDYNQEEGDYLPYNCLHPSERWWHYWLFDELKEEKHDTQM